MKEGLSLSDKTTAEVRLYSLRSGQYHSQNLRIEQATFIFDLVHPQALAYWIRIVVDGTGYTFAWKRQLLGKLAESSDFVDSKPAVEPSEALLHLRQPV